MMPGRLKWIVVGTCAALVIIFGLARVFARAADVCDGSADCASGQTCVVVPEGVWDARGAGGGPWWTLVRPLHQCTRLCGRGLPPCPAPQSCFLQPLHGEHAFCR